MKFMLMLIEDETVYGGPTKSGPALLEIAQKHWAFVKELGPARFAGSGLKGSATSTTVRTANGKQTLHDGPFAETKEQVGGYYVIEAPDMNAATEIARRVPIYADGGVEIRPTIPQTETTGQGKQAMQYMLMIYENDKPYMPGTGDPAAARMIDKHMAFIKDIGGAMIGGAGLMPAATARTVHTAKSGAKTVHDGPFAEAKEQLGGYYIIDVADLDAAIAIARKVPLYKDGAIEVRPMMKGPAM